MCLNHKLLDENDKLQAKGGMNQKIEIKVIIKMADSLRKINLNKRYYNLY